MKGGMCFLLNATLFFGFGRSIGSLVNRHFGLELVRLPVAFDMLSNCWFMNEKCISNFLRPQLLA